MRVLLVEHLLSAEQTWSGGPERERAGLLSPSRGELGVPALLFLSLEPPPASPQEGPAHLKGGWGGAEGTRVTAEGRGSQALPFWPGFGLGFVHDLRQLLAPFTRHWLETCSLVLGCETGHWLGSLYPMPSELSAPVCACSGGGTAGGLEWVLSSGAGRETPDCCSKQTE